jgi:hypothetical protein
LLALLHVIVIIGLIIGPLIDMVEFVKYKYEKAFPAPHTISSGLANPKKSGKEGPREPNRTRRQYGVDSRGTLDEETNPHGNFSRPAGVYLASRAHNWARI